MLPIKASILIALAFLAASLGSASVQETTGSTSPNSPFPLECATRDLQTVAQLEQAGVSGPIFDAAFSTIMRARRACYEARVTEGLALYDSLQTRILAKHAQ